jgi:hypothetical protein
MMDKELDDALCRDFPAIFKDRRGDMRATAMCWGFECGDGWEPIIRAMCECIRNHVANARDKLIWKKMRALPEYAGASIEEIEELKRGIKLSGLELERTEVYATQVKEKYGTLRFYLSGYDDALSGIEMMADRISAKTCEVCGATSEMGQTGWIPRPFECDCGGLLRSKDTLPANQMECEECGKVEDVALAQCGWVKTLCRECAEGDERWKASWVAYGEEDR